MIPLMTDREWRVLELLAEGLPLKAIASAMQAHYSTVQAHILPALRRKTGTTSMFQLGVWYARQIGDRE